MNWIQAAILSPQRDTRLAPPGTSLVSDGLGCFLKHDQPAVFQAYPVAALQLRGGGFGGWGGFDMFFLLPGALFILQAQELSTIQQLVSHPRLVLLIPLLGIISSVALVSYISASRQLPLGLFGLLGYVEPVLLFWVAFLFLDESMTLRAWFTYIPIWIAVALIVAEGAMKWARSAQGARADKT